MKPEEKAARLLKKHMLRTVEAAFLLGCTARTVNELVTAGKLKANKLVRQRRISTASVIALQSAEEKKSE